MIKKISAETWMPLQFNGHRLLRKKYAVSSNGRAASFLLDVNEDGRLLNGSLTSGYRTLNLHLEKGNGTIYLHREIARIFCKKASTKHSYVIHVNHKKEDNRIKNLRWATGAEVSIHQQNSPQKKAYKKLQASRTEGLKLNAIKVKAIKVALNHPKRKLTYKLLAEKYGVSEMTLYRIKSGENWAGIK